jgi:hypothetical protein
MRLRDEAVKADTAVPEMNGMLTYNAEQCMHTYAWFVFGLIAAEHTDIMGECHNALPKQLLAVLWSSSRVFLHADIGRTPQCTEHLVFYNSRIMCCVH